MSQENNEGQGGTPPEPPKEEDKKEPKPAEPMEFKVHNGSRDPASRSVRAANPTHRGLKQFLPIRQQRLLRGRPVLVTRSEIEEYREQLRELVTRGMIYITSMDENEVDLDTLEPLHAPSATPLLPHPLLDNAANDASGGQELLGLPGEVQPPEDFKMPVEPPDAVFDGEAPGAQSFDQAVATAEPHEEPPSPSRDAFPDFAKEQPHHKKKGKGDR